MGGGEKWIVGTWLMEAEREQGITIDVAYRYFSTDKRKFIIADCPGHEQYTRNMATGASTCNLAVILIDARHGVKAVDNEIMSLLDSAAVTFQCVLTKADKVKAKDREVVLAQTRAALSKHPAAFPEIVLTSSEKGDGIATLRTIIATLV